MKVLKFGGTSVGSPQRFMALGNLINNGERKIVVLSAMSGTTNTLEGITKLCHKNNRKDAEKSCDELQGKYVQVVDELLKDNHQKAKAHGFITKTFQQIKDHIRAPFSNENEKFILAQGEIMSTTLFHFHLGEVGVKSVLLSALDFMRVDSIHEPDNFYIRENLSRLLNEHKDNTLFITQGYICKDVDGKTDNLSRGGSDYTASLIGAAIGAEEIQIWTDIDGFHNNDPRYVENTKSIAKLTFEEAAELAYFGAKILHPLSVRPAQNNGIPVRLKNTMRPSDEGTLITAESEKSIIKAVAAKDGITAIKIKSARMLLAYGFLRKVFEVFEAYKTPIDMITTSEIAISLTIDDTTNLDNIVAELQNFGHVEIDREQAIVCVVGDFGEDKSGVASRVFEGLKNIPIRMISYGGSNHNISLLVKAGLKQEALKALHAHLFPAQ